MICLVEDKKQRRAAKAKAKPKAKSKAKAKAKGKAKAKVGGKRKGAPVAVEDDEGDSLEPRRLDFDGTEDKASSSGQWPEDDRVGHVEDDPVGPVEHHHHPVGPVEDEPVGAVDPVDPVDPVGPVEGDEPMGPVEDEPMGPVQDHPVGPVMAPPEDQSMPSGYSVGGGGGVRVHSTPEILQKLQPNNDFKFLLNVNDRRFVIQCKQQSDKFLLTPYSNKSYSKSFRHDKDSWLDCLKDVHSHCWKKWAIIAKQSPLKTGMQRQTPGKIPVDVIDALRGNIENLPDPVQYPK